MSSHGSSHGGSSGGSIFSTAKNWFATKSPSQLNPLSSIDAVGHNLVGGVVKSTTGWVADILNPLWAAAKNAGSLLSPGAYREHGIKNIPKSIAWIGAHILDSANNLVAGSTVRGLDHAYTNGVTNSVVDITSGTTDRVPLVGKLAGNGVKAVNVIPAAPIRFFARVWEKTVDRLVDWTKGFATEKGEARHLKTVTASAWWHGWGGHH
jgi:hypothetical protein